MLLLARILTPKTVVHAHCDLPCGVYDPAQARIEAESVKAIIEKYQANEDPAFRTRALIIKEQRADLVKHHLWVLSDNAAAGLDDSRAFGVLPDACVVGKVLLRYYPLRRS